MQRRGHTKVDVWNKAQETALISNNLGIKVQVKKRSFCYKCTKELRYKILKVHVAKKTEFKEAWCQTENIARRSAQIYNYGGVVLFPSLDTQKTNRKKIVKA